VSVPRPNLSRMSNLGRNQTALLVVDVQNDVVGNAWHRDEVVGRIAGLVDRARDADIPVVWVQHNEPEMPIGTPGWDIVDALVPEAGESRIDKQYGDSFADTNLESIFAALDVGHIVLCGAQTDACITATLYGGIHRGYDVTLVQDAHTTDDTDFGGRQLPAELLVNHLVRAATYSELPDVVLTAKPADAISW
jgi:nicotinamidase-related amidase